MDNEKTHKVFSASSISDNLSGKRKTRKMTKDKPIKTPNLPLKVIEDSQPYQEDYNDDQNGSRTTNNLSINNRIITKTNVEKSRLPQDENLIDDIDIPSINPVSNCGSFYPGAATTSREKDDHVTLINKPDDVGNYDLEYAKMKQLLQESERKLNEQRSLFNLKKMRMR